MSISWSPDGKRIVSGSFDTTVKIWNTNTGCELKTLPHGDPVRSVSWSPDGRRIASGSWQTVKIWDAATGQEVMTLPSAQSPLSWSPDGSKIATGVAIYPSNLIKIWNAETGQELIIYSGHERPLQQINWSPDGSMIASIETELWWVKIWDPETGDEFWPQVALAFSVGWSPDSRRIVLGRDVRADASEVHIRDVESTELLKTFRGHGTLVNTIDWSPDGRKIASGTSDLTVRVWGPRPE